MSEKATGKSGKTWLYVVGMLVGLPLLYVLSVGPLYVLALRGIFPDGAFRELYSPLVDFSQQTGTRESLTVYTKTWLYMTGTSE